jgi:hypothetical protein
MIEWWMSRTISPCISSDESNANASSVAGTEPSIEFSIGTTPPSTRPRSTASNTSAIDEHGTGSKSAMGSDRSASSEKVPAGPRKA